MNLYQLNDCLNQANEALESGASPEDVRAAIDSISEDMNNKIVSVVYWIRNLSANVEAIKAEENRLESNRKSLENQIDGLKSYIRENMVASDMKRCTDGIINVTICNAKPVLVVDDESLIPEEYQKIDVKTSLDKKAMLDALKEGKEVAGASIGKSEAGLLIK